MCWCKCWRSYPTCLSISGIMITITNTIAIPIAIISNSPRPNADISTHRWWDVGTSLRRKVSVWDLLVICSNCLPVQRNQRLELLTPRQWGIVRSWHGGRTKDMVQTMILTNNMLLAAIRRPPSAIIRTPNATRQTLPALCHLPYATWCLVPALDTSQYLAPATDTSQYLCSAT